MSAEREAGAPAETAARKTYRRDGLCPDCGTEPRTKKGYCQSCWNARAARYSRTAAARKRQAADGGASAPRGTTPEPSHEPRRGRTEPPLRLVPAKPAGEPVLAEGCRAADELVAREVFGYEVGGRPGRSGRTWSAGAGGADEDRYYASGPFEGARLHDLTTSTTAMWLIPRRMAELGLAEEFAAWLQLSLKAQAGQEFRGDLHALLYGPVPAPLVFARAAVEVVRELRAVAP